MRFFVGKNFFGTDGIRGKVGQFPLTLEALPKLGMAIGQWMTEKVAEPKIFLAHDTRNSCSWIKAALQSGLLQYPVTLEDAGVLPTPGVLQIVRTHHYAFGLVISASHNPYFDNGIKIMSPNGKISEADEKRIMELFHQHVASQEATPVAPVYGTSDAVTNGGQLYKEGLLSHFEPRFLKGLKVVLDCANGAGHNLARLTFEPAGAQVFTICQWPTGFNINEDAGALQPQRLQEAVLANKADMGFAFDGDADRVIAVNKLGQIKDGDDMMMLLLDNPKYANTPAVVGTILTNQGFEQALHKRGKKLIRVNVGDKYISERLEAENLLMGGEPSGHIILRDYMPTGDGMYCALRIAQTVKMTGNFEMHTFEKFPQVTANLKVKERKDLASPEIARLISAAQQQLAPGRLVIRYSGTEPLLRIMAEAPDFEFAEKTVRRLVSELEMVIL
jgi:phosphoglucosamine mutase